MELHSYAKRRASKKWSIEQKRKLVDARIEFDGMFTQKPTTSVEPWKRILNIAKLDDYNVFFVRTQWSKMVSKYKQYKQNRLGNIPTKAIDAEMVQKLTQEWEFFQPIHQFMTRKTNNLHSYALTTEEPAEHHNNLAAANEHNSYHHQQQHHLLKKCQQQMPLVSAASSIEQMNIYSSDTNDYTNAIATNFRNLNTDHDSYSKKCINKQLNYFADASEDNTLESMVFEFGDDYSNEQVVGTQNTDDGKKDEIIISMPQLSQHQQQQKTSAEKVTNLFVDGNKQKPSAAPLSERDKYYRHKRRFNHRLEQRFDAILNVFGQIVKAEYPSLDVSALTGAASSGIALATKLFSSDDDLDDDDNDNDVSDAEHEHRSSDAEANLHEQKKQRLE